MKINRRNFLKYSGLSVLGIPFLLRLRHEVRDCEVVATDNHALDQAQHFSNCMEAHYPEFGGKVGFLLMKLRIN